MSALADTRTVVWKEWQELLDQVMGSKAGLIGLIVMVLFFGVFSPYASGPASVTSPMLMFNLPFLAAMLVIQPVVDAFAGERERHTLETLLASPLDDSAILLGKLVAAVLPAWLFAAVAFVLSLATASLFYGGGALILPPAWLAAGSAVGVVFLPLLFATLGVFVSLKTSTVRQAAQAFGAMLIGLLVGPVVVVQMLPDGVRARLFAPFAALSPMRLVALAAVVLALLCALVLLGAVRRFRRGRLNLD